MKTIQISDTDIIIKFSNKEAADHFATWLCESGEQSYWEWMEYREEEEDGDITAVNFHYHGEENENIEDIDPDYGDEESNTFMCDNIIRTTCGRLNRSNF